MAAPPSCTNREAGAPLTVTSVTVNTGDQSRPVREPCRPGCPVQPVCSSGTIAIRTGSSVAFGIGGMALSKFRARRRSDYNYQTQLLLIILSVGGLLVFFALQKAGVLN